MGLFQFLKERLLGGAPEGSQEHQIADMMGGISGGAMVAAAAPAITGELASRAQLAVAGSGIPPLAAADMIVNSGAPGGGKGRSLG